MFAAMVRLKYTLKYEHNSKFVVASLQVRFIAHGVKFAMKDNLMVVYEEVSDNSSLSFAMRC